MANLKKVTQFNKVTAFLKKAPSFSLLKFEKTTHTSLESLRKQLKKSDAHIMVVKNTVFQKAVNKLAANKDTAYLRDVQKKIKNLKENTALMGLGADWSIGMNAFFTFSKADKSVGFKIGCLDKTTYGETDLIRIAQLPSKGQLFAQVLGSMKNPLTHMTYALKYNAQKLVYILNAKAKAG